MIRQALLLLAAGAAVSVLSVGAGGRLAPRDAPLLLLALAEQAPVRAWDAERVRAGLDAGLLVVDGRPAEEHRAAAPKGSLNVPFDERHDRIFQLPEGRQVTAVLVLLDDPRRARELAQFLAREWAIRDIATFAGGWRAWREADLP